MLTALRRPPRAAVGIFAAIVLLAATPVRAQSNDVRACVQKDSAQVRIVGPGEKCRDTESLLIWAIAGPPGPQGAKGDPGEGLATGTIRGRLTRCGVTGVIGSEYETVSVLGEGTTALTGTDGVFVLRYLPPGDYTLGPPWTFFNATPSQTSVHVDTGTTVDIGDVLRQSVLADPMNCGACGNVCGAGMQCANGTCVPGCAWPTVSCSGVCVNTMIDPNNCMFCGNVCPSGVPCVNGACMSSCAPPSTNCGGTCTNLLVDPTNCGLCGRACPVGQVCGAGFCVPMPSPGGGS